MRKVLLSSLKNSTLELVQCGSHKDGSRRKDCFVDVTNFLFFVVKDLSPSLPCSLRLDESDLLSYLLGTRLTPVVLFELQETFLHI